jgi:hypothetical protein
MALITQVSDAVLWQKLQNEWEDGGRPGFFPYGGSYYQHFQTSSNEDAYKVIPVISGFLDTRSPSVSKRASYRKLDNG